MHETNGGATGVGEGDYQPRHAAHQLDDGLMEVLADAADQYRYGQLRQQYDAEFAIIRARLLTDKESDEDRAFIDSQRQKIAESIGRQAAAKTYADELRSQLYYAPADGVYYHGRHRKEDRPLPEEPRPEPESKPRHAREEPPEPEPEPEPDLPPQEEGAVSGPAGAGETGPAAPPEPPPEEPPPEEPPEDIPPVETPPAAKPPQEKQGVFEHLRHAWYAGVAAAAVYFSDPEKGRRRKVVAATAAALGLVVAGGVAGWLYGHWQDWSHHHPVHPSHPSRPPCPPHPPQAVGPPPNSERFFDTIKPFNYHGESYEWTIAAHRSGPAQATPNLLRVIDYARDHGLRIDTWGNPSKGRWGINSVTVQLPNGTCKSYYDTPRKFAIMQWYAKGMGPKG